MSRSSANRRRRPPTSAESANRSPASTATSPRTVAGSPGTASTPLETAATSPPTTEPSTEPTATPPRSAADVGWRAAWLPPWRGPAGLAAAVVLLVQLVWRTAYLAQGYFSQDDFLMLHLGGTSRLGPSYLFQDYSGHLWPGAFLVSFVEARLAPLSWPAACLPVVVMQLAAGALMWMLLTRLLGDRWERLPLLAVFCFSPLTLWATQWWAVAITLLPIELCGIGAALCYLARDSTSSAPPPGLTPGVGVRWRVGVLALTATGLMFQERAVLIPVLVLAVAVVDQRSGRGWQRLVTPVRSETRLWSGMAAIVVAYLLLHLWLAPVQSAGGGHGGYTGLVSNFLFRNAIPGLFGGPWTGAVLPGVAVVPPGWVVAIGLALLAAVAVPTLAWGGTASRLAWLLLAIYTLLDVALLFGGRASYGSAFGLLPRYASDLMPIVAVCLAGAIRDVRLPERLTARRPAYRQATAIVACCVALTVAYTGSAAVTTRLMAPDLYNTAARSYVDTLRADVRAQPTAVIYDSTVPDDVLISWFGARDRVSTVFGIAPDSPAYDVPSEQLRMVDSTGHLREIELADPVRSVPGPSPSCGYNVTLTPVLVPLQAPVAAAKNVLEFGYYTSVDDVAVLTAGTQTVTFPVSPGLHSVDLVLDTALDSFTVQLTRTAGTVCLAVATVGVPQPVAP